MIGLKLLLGAVILSGIFNHAKGSNMDSLRHGKHDFEERLSAEIIKQEDEAIRRKALIENIFKEYEAFKGSDAMDGVCPESETEFCDSKGKKIFICHYNKRKNSFKTLCVSKNGAGKRIRGRKLSKSKGARKRKRGRQMKRGRKNSKPKRKGGHIGRHEKDYCGRCINPEWGILAASTFLLPDDTQVTVEILPSDPETTRLSLVTEDGTVLVDSLVSTSLVQLSIFIEAVLENPIINLEIDPALGDASEDTAIVITRFIISQVWTTLSQDVEGPRRRLDEPGCDYFPDLCCDLKCCAQHDKCYYDNGCDASSWIPGVGQPTTIECVGCNAAAVACIALRCKYAPAAGTIAGLFEEDKCYDNSCDQFFDCPFSLLGGCNCDCNGCPSTTTEATTTPASTTEATTTPASTTQETTEEETTPMTTEAMTTEDPCSDSGDPCCGNSDPCCDSPDPCCGRSSDCDDGGANGDPHMVTFDNLRYSCQGKGEFILFKSLTSDAQVQSRFEKKSSLVSLATGFAAVGGPTSPVVELSIPNDDRNSLELYVDGVVTDPYSGYEDDEVLVTETSNTFTVYFKTTQMSVVARYVLISFRHLAVNVRLPSTFRGEDIRGMMGSPDDDPSNDWMALNGTVLPFPTSGLRGEDAYDYCMAEWCIRDPSLSLFTYSEPFDFAFYSGCDDAYPGAVDVSGASAELQALCGTDEACLIDGIELGLDGAQSLLESEAAVSGSSSTALFRANPATVVVGTSVNVALIVNLTASTDDVSAVEEFSIYRVDSETLVVENTVIVTLPDTGLGVGEDTVAGDFIFSNILAINSATPGEAFSFQAVPVIGGVPDNTSPFVFTALNAVRSYSRESGIGRDTESIGVITVDAIDGLVLVIQYSWPADQTDLDTATVFLGIAVGFGCGSSPYMTFSGDNTGAGGTETVRVRLGQSHDESQWTDQVFVDLFAGWFGSTNKGPASITAFTEIMLEDGSIEGSNNAVTFAMDPGAQSGCSSTADGGVNVGAANVSIELDGSVTIELIPASA